MPTVAQHSVLVKFSLMLGFGVLLFLFPIPEKATAMSKPNNSIILVNCHSESAKNASPDQLCSLFIEQMAQAYTGHQIQPVDNTLNDEIGVQATLVILHSSPFRIEARIDWSSDSTNHKGEPLGTAVAGSTFSASMLGTFLDNLIAKSPAP